MRLERGGERGPAGLRVGGRGANNTRASPGSGYRVPVGKGGVAIAARREWRPPRLTAALGGVRGMPVPRSRYLPSAAVLPAGCGAEPPVCGAGAAAMGQCGVGSPLG